MIRGLTLPEIQEALGHRGSLHEPDCASDSISSTLEDYPLAKLDAPSGEWLVEEVKMDEEEALHRDWRALLIEPIREPIVLFEDASGGHLWDGCHRSAGARAQGKASVRAYVGREVRGE